MVYHKRVFSLYHAVANTISATYAWHTMGKLGVIHQIYNRFPVFLLAVLRHGIKSCTKSLLVNRAVIKGCNLLQLNMADGP